MLSLNTSRAREEEPFVEGGVHVSPKVGLTLTSRHLQGQPKKPNFPSIVCGCDALQPILAIPFQSGSASCAWYLLMLSGPKGEGRQRLPFHTSLANRASPLLKGALKRYKIDISSCQG
jgi:hypothetical protein